MSPKLCMSISIFLTTYVGNFRAIGLPIQDFTCVFANSIEKKLRRKKFSDSEISIRFSKPGLKAVKKAFEAISIG